MTDTNSDAPIFDIVREEDGKSGRYVIYLPDGLEAEMTYRRIDAGIIDIQHTFVPPAHRTEGLALKLVEAGIADARRDGMKIIPSCSYVAAQFRRHPDWADLRA